MKRKLKMGMIGGGQNSFIGAIHRASIAIDNEIELVCGAFSSNPETSILSGENIYLPRNRIYRSFQEMFEKECQLPEKERMDFVSIVTPNHIHFEPAKLALQNGFHVVCEKPLCFSMEEALVLKKLVNETGLLFAVAYTYTGYPMVKQAKEIVKLGTLGKIRKVVVEYPQGWLSTPLEQTGQIQALWRTDPKRSGKAGSVGDIGTHALNLAETITNLKVTELCADVSTFVEKRQLDDDANILVHFDNGAKGILHCSQVCAGEENALNIKVYGEKGSIYWHQHDPNTMFVRWLNKPTEIFRTGNKYMSSIASNHTRISAGHPEGYIEAFANIYRSFYICLSAKINKTKTPRGYEFPTIEDGVRGMQFIETVISSSKSDKKWLSFS